MQFYNFSKDELNIISVLCFVGLYLSFTVFFSSFVLHKVFKNVDLLTLNNVNE